VVSWFAGGGRIGDARSVIGHQRAAVEREAVGEGAGAVLDLDDHAAGQFFESLDVAGLDADQVAVADVGRAELSAVDRFGGVEPDDDVGLAGDGVRAAQARVGARDVLGDDLNAAAGFDEDVAVECGRAAILGAGGDDHAAGHDSRGGRAHGADAIEAGFGLIVDDEVDVGVIGGVVVEVDAADQVHVHAAGAAGVVGDRDAAGGGAVAHDQGSAGGKLPRALEREVVVGGEDAGVPAAGGAVGRSAGPGGAVADGDVERAGGGRVRGEAEHELTGVGQILDRGGGGGAGAQARVCDHRAGLERDVAVRVQRAQLGVVAADDAAVADLEFVGGGRGDAQDDHAVFVGHADRAHRAAGVEVRLVVVDADLAEHRGLNVFVERPGAAAGDEQLGVGVAGDVGIIGTVVAEGCGRAVEDEGGAFAVHLNVAQADVGTSKSDGATRRREAGSDESESVFS
jgi:hypothetical protein